MNADEMLLWVQVIERLANVGVKSWSVIHAALEDAGADEAAIAALRPKWDQLAADVQRAAGQ